MCGIVGYITDETTLGAEKRAKYLAQALTVDVLRGEDSTGVYVVPHEHTDITQRHAGWFKSLASGPDFVDKKEYKDLMMHTADYKYAVGHNRFATMGAIDVDSAHPFQEGPITLVHNGTLDTTYNLPIPMHELDDVDVDSHTICHNLVEHDVDSVVSELCGAFALVWHDSRDDSLNIVRNTKRPLHMARVKNQKTIIFASEGGMLHWIAERNQMQLEDIVYPSAGTYMKFMPDDLMNPEIRELDLHTGWSYYDSRPRTTMTPYDYAYGLGDDYDDDEWEPVGNVRRTPRPKVQEGRPTRVNVGGRLRPVPLRSQEMLLDVDLLTDEDKRFTPVSWTAVNGDSGVVSGFFVESGMTAAIYNIKECWFDQYEDVPWTVRPITVKRHDSREPVAICQLRKYKWDGGAVTPNLNAMDDDIPFEMESEPLLLEHQEAEYTYPGPHGTWVTAEKMTEMLSHGCVSCAKPLTLDDAGDVEWVNNGRDPLCYDCCCDLDDGINIHRH